MEGLDVFECQKGGRPSPHTWDLVSANRILPQGGLLLPRTPAHQQGPEFERAGGAALLGARRGEKKED